MTTRIAYRIEWIEMRSGKKGHGLPVYDVLDEIFQICQWLNQDLKGLLHYPQAVRLGKVTR